MVDAVALAIGAQTTQERVDTAALVSAIGTLNATLIANANLLGGQSSPALPGTLTAIDADLNLIASQLMRLVDVNKSIADSLFHIDLNGRAQLAAMNTANQLQGILVSTTKDTNDFNRAVAEQALVASGQGIPKLPPWDERIKKTIKDASEMVSIARLEGYVTDLMKDSMKDIFTYIQATSLYRTAAAYLERYKQAILAIEFPSISSVKSKTANLLGLRSAVYIDT
jgi:hypothetical protein